MFREKNCENLNHKKKIKENRNSTEIKVLVTVSLAKQACITSVLIFNFNSETWSLAKYLKRKSTDVRCKKIYRKTNKCKDKCWYNKRKQEANFMV